MFPVMFTSEPSNHKGGDPLLMRALGSQYCSSSPAGQARVENLGNCRALEGPPKQDTHKPYEARGVSETNPLAIAPRTLNSSFHHVLVSSIGNPHALGTKKLVGISFGMPPILVNARQAVFGKEPKDPGTSCPKCPTKDFGDGQIGQKSFPANHEGIFGLIDKPADSGFKSTSQANMFRLVPKVSKGIEWIWLWSWRSIDECL
mmetsp:Transcript_847/g.1963  ORF Transcript_847/g.1963 Transcript_847/m.1963 type:complete len:203 (-) Transcript_847:314-922(-)